MMVHWMKLFLLFQERKGNQSSLPVSSFHFPENWSKSAPMSVIVTSLYFNTKFVSKIWYVREIWSPVFQWLSKTPNGNIQDSFINSEKNPKQQTHFQSFPTWKENHGLVNKQWNTALLWGNYFFSFSHYW